jgi:hypothetical protein
MIAWPAGSIDLPFSTSNPLVDCTIITSTSATAVLLTNWSGGPLKNLKLTLSAEVPGATPTLASGRPVKASNSGKQRIFTFDLDVADALILR